MKSLRSEGTPLSEIALLYRSNAQSRVLEHALFNASLPYRVYGGLRFFERQEIKHALAYLRLVANPEDDGALLRVINLPTRGIGARSLEQLQEAARMRGISLWESACSTPLAGKAGIGVRTFVQLIEALRAQCLGLSLPEMVEIVVAGSGLKEYYEAEREGADRIENLNELVTAATGFEIEGVFAPADDSAAADPEPLSDETADPRLRALNDFLSHASLEAGEHQATAGAEALQLMTVHSAKGLEFQAVFISGLEEGLFPHENSLNVDDGVEEERRLMYVALTRARRRLYLSVAQSRMLHGQTRYNLVSRFLSEVPEGLLKRLNTRRPTTYGAGVSASTWSTPNSPPNSPRRPFPVESASPWKVGQNVLHTKFGPGVIVNAEGRGSDARVQVNFRQAGLKWLSLDYAKLTPA